MEHINFVLATIVLHSIIYSILVLKILTADFLIDSSIEFDATGANDVPCVCLQGTRDMWESCVRETEILCNIIRYHYENVNDNLKLTVAQKWTHTFQQNE